MENDKQMNDFNLEKVKKTFLHDDLLTKNTKPEIYSLPDEFAKSKQNRSFLVYGMILIYASIIGIGVYWVTTAEEQKSKRVEVNIAEFRQFNLMELLEEKKESEQKLAKLQSELEKVKADSLKQIKKLTPEEQRKAMIALNDKLIKLEADYKEEVKSKKKELKTLQKSVNIEKKHNKKNARETEKLIKDYQNLSQNKTDEIHKLTVSYEKKIAKLKTEFENDLEQLILRYNPTYSRGEMAAILNSGLGVTVRGSWAKYIKTLINEGFISEQEVGELRQKVRSQEIIIANLKEIDFTNSIPLALERLEQLSLSIIGDYEIICGKLANRLEQRSNNSTSFEYALNYLAQNNNADGYVLEAQNSSRLVIYLESSNSVAKGEIAQIFKNDAANSSPIAQIELIPENGRLTAKVKKRFGSVKIEPFDRVIIQK